MPEEIDEITLTAYALGELDGAEHGVERGELEARLASDALARRQVEEIRATARWVTAELAAETMPGLSDLQHAAIERKLALAGHPEGLRVRLRPVRRNWAFWGSLAASVVIVCTVMASVLPKLYHLGYVNHGEASSGIATPASGPAPFIVEGPETPTAALHDQSKPAIGEEPYADAGGFLNAAPPVERGENTFVRVADFPLSSVPTSSAYPDDGGKLASVAKFLDNHQLPPAGFVRTDEVINAFPYHYAVPTSDETVGASVEVADCPWNASHRLLRVGLGTADAVPATKPSTSPASVDRSVADLKVRIEFNPALAGAYRLLGYETGPSAGTFRDGPMEPRPAGMIAAGRSATVLYEVIPAGMAGPSSPLPVPPLKYQKLTPLAQTSRELATVSIRYRDAGTASVKLREFAVSDDGPAFAAASGDFRTAAAAAAFALALRDSAYKGAASYQLVIDMLTPADGNEVSAERGRLLELAKKAKAIAGEQ